MKACVWASTLMRPQATSWQWCRGASTQSFSFPQQNFSSSSQAGRARWCEAERGAGRGEGKVCGWTELARRHSRLYLGGGNNSSIEVFLMHETEKISHLKVNLVTESSESESVFTFELRRFYPKCLTKEEKLCVWVYEPSTMLRLHRDESGALCVLFQCSFEVLCVTEVCGEERTKEGEERLSFFKG